MFSHLQCSFFHRLHFGDSYYPFLHLVVWFVIFSATILFHRTLFLRLRTVLYLDGRMSIQLMSTFLFLLDTVNDRK